MIVPPKPRRRLKSLKTESVCIIDEIVLCMHLFFSLVIQNNKNEKEKKILVNTTNPIQIREQGIPKKKWIIGSCKRETVRSTKRIVNPFRQCLLVEYTK